MRFPGLPVSRRRLIAHRDYLARRVEDLRISLSEVEQQRDELLDDVDRSCAWAINVMSERDQAQQRAGTYKRDADEAREALMAAEARAADLASQLDQERLDAKTAGEQSVQALRERKQLEDRAAELEQAIRTFVASEDTHEPGPFVKDGNWHEGPCVEGGPRMEDVYPDGFQVCADEECFAYWPCDVERLRRVLDGHDRQEADSLPQHGVATGGNVLTCHACAHPATHYDPTGSLRLCRSHARTHQASPAGRAMVPIHEEPLREADGDH